MSDAETPIVGHDIAADLIHERVRQRPGIVKRHYGLNRCGTILSDLGRQTEAACRKAIESGDMSSQDDRIAAMLADVVEDAHGLADAGIADNGTDAVDGWIEWQKYLGAVWMSNRCRDAGLPVHVARIMTAAFCGLVEDRVREVANSTNTTSTTLH